MLARVIRWISIALCLVVATSFALFALDQMRSASDASQAGIAGQTPAPVSAPHHSGPRKAIDGAASALESPFTAAGVNSSNAWADRGALLGLSLLLYGAGMGYFARWVESGARRHRRSGKDDPSATGSAFAA